MKVNGRPTRTLWHAADGQAAEIIDQTKLPHNLEIERLTTLEDAAHAIKAMRVRGAPLIGATAGYGMWLAMREDASDTGLARAHETLFETRPTAVNLRWALDLVRTRLSALKPAERVEVALAMAKEICEGDIAINKGIGDAGLPIIKALAAKKPASEPVNILTHCNAGWLATVDWGTATAPIYMAHDAGIPVHIWVDETRPRNQGASLTAWEFVNHGVPHTVIVDNAGGHYMQHGQVDMIIVGSDRTTAGGDVCNKIGTYLKALAAKDNDVPFYVGLPSPTIDWNIEDGVHDVPIEERAPDEVKRITGQLDNENIVTVLITPEESPAKNPAFDVTPARLITGLITERGIAEASRDGLLELFPEYRAT